MAVQISNLTKQKNMASKKITELDALETSADDDLIAIVDTSAGATKKQTKTNLLKETSEKAIAFAIALG